MRCKLWRRTSPFPSLVRALKQHNSSLMTSGQSQYGEVVRDKMPTRCIGGCRRTFIADQAIDR